MSANKIKILSISEKSFFLEKELLPNTLEDCEKELHPGIGFKIMILSLIHISEPTRPY